jgi:hypothetical protein
MTARDIGGHKNVLMQAESAAVGKAVTIEIELDGNFAAMSHVFLGVQMYDEAAGAGSLILDSTGSFAITVQTVQTKSYEAPTVATIDATAPVTISWAGGTFKIKVIPDSLTDTVSWKVVATAYRN